MSHVDDGTLHAFLDGELSVVEVERTEAHLAACAGCRARLEEERALIERAARLLGTAVPPGPERVAPPLHQLRRPPPRSAWRRVRIPLAWAATIVLAIGLGYYAGTTGSMQQAEAPAAFQTAAADERRADQTTPGHLPETRDAERDPGVGTPSPASAAPAEGALAGRPAREESVEGKTVPPAAPAPSPPAQPAGRLARDQSRSGVRAADRPAAVAENDMVTEGAASRLSTTWPVIEARPARDLLGSDPAAIPGFEIRTMRRNPSGGAVPEIVVEQEIAPGVVVSLFEQPIAPQAVDSLQAKARANERLARFVGGLRIEIAGPLPMDSLSKLLELVRP